MTYEVVELEEKLVVGITARTSNQDPEMGQIIGSLWYRFYNEGIYQAIGNKANSACIGMYSDYETDDNGKYNCTVCCEVNQIGDPPKESVVKKIPTGKYARFIVKGHVQKAVLEFWQELWSMDLNRKYSCDFEEYQPNGDMENSEIHMYIALND
ncbi:MAG TPA: GyrI-like domain-containing protein [Lachnospiraceae bacterium]|nr:GyrI-like domain-containing protein [Lachnospiraceae bacterium]